MLATITYGLIPAATLEKKRGEKKIVQPACQGGGWVRDAMIINSSVLWLKTGEKK